MQSAASTSDPTIAKSTEAASDSANATSDTNNQVEGVDEADFIKNDAKYVYAALNGALRIVQAWPADESHEVAKVELPGQPRQLFIEKDRALVYVAIPRAPGSNQVKTPPVPSLAGTPASQPPVTTAAATSPSITGSRAVARNTCSYGYDCEFTGDGNDTAVLLFDITDRSAPKQLRRIDINGSLLAARRIGDAVHTVLVSPELAFQGLSYSGAYFGCGDAKSLDTAIEQLEAQRRRNAQVIEQADLGDLLPKVTEDGESIAAASCQNMYIETEPSGAAFTSLVSLDMTQDNAPAVSTIISKAGAVYASEGALYMSVNKNTPGTPGATGMSSPQNDYRSAIHKFSLGVDVASAKYVASGKIKGNVLNQFSMDEYKNHLRVATSFGKVSSPDVHSTLSIVSQQGERLVLDGEVDDIAPMEDIRSVRFDGDRGFVVTFKKTDPLYVFDLSDPTQPAITGELKIPGFSTYMHMLDDQHLLTIGYNAADQGSFAWFTGVLLQIFDVSDPQNPQLAHKLEIGTRGTSSEALANHLAFTLFQNKLAVPMTLCEGGNEHGGYGTNMTFSGLMIFDVSVEGGIKERGRVAHPGANGQYNNAACSNWWSRAGSDVQRSVFMDEFVYSIAPDVMRVQDLNMLGSDLAAVSLTD